MLPSPFFSRTIYYTSYRQVYAVEAQTVLRCCPGWSQQPGDQGCLSRECPSPDPESVRRKRPCLKGCPRHGGVQAPFLHLVALITAWEPSRAARAPTLPP